jgi:hypothetical protein
VGESDVLEGEGGVGLWEGKHCEVLKLLCLSSELGLDYRAE